MPDLGPYATEVLSAYAVTLGALGALVGVSVWQSRRARARLGEVEERRPRGQGGGGLRRGSAPSATGGDAR